METPVSGNAQRRGKVVWNFLGWCRDPVLSDYRAGKEQVRGIRQEWDGMGFVLHHDASPKNKFS